VSDQPAASDPLRGHPLSRLPATADVSGLPHPSKVIAAEAEVGHVNLRVLDLERALRFYRNVIGLTVTQQDAESAFLAAGDYHHHVALNVWGAPAEPPPPEATGLHHFALKLPDSRALAEVVLRILRSGHKLLGATDHGVNLAVYLRDPDGNGLELMVDRPRSEWPRTPNGRLAMRVDPIDLAALVVEGLTGGSSGHGAKGTE
jgi:catechol 2,3-dioxygenase